jgi:hypothetical protein
MPVDAVATGARSFAGTRRRFGAVSGHFHGLILGLGAIRGLCFLRCGSLQKRVNGVSSIKCSHPSWAIGNPKPADYVLLGRNT